jgi:hypothetical protein
VSELLWLHHLYLLISTGIVVYFGLLLIFTTTKNQIAPCALYPIHIKVIVYGFSDIVFAQLSLLFTTNGLP